MNINSIRRVLLSIAVLSAAASCAEQLQEAVQQPPVEGAVMTKVINTPADSEEGTLLLFLTEETADAIATGDNSFADQLSNELNVNSFGPIFSTESAKDPVSRKHNLHRWYAIEFEGVDNATAAARLTALEAVVRVQYNKFVVPASDLSFSPHVPSATAYAAGSMPFNDPKLVDQWHYINTGDKSVANTAVVGGDIAVQDAWKLTAGDPNVIVAIIDGPVKYNHPDLAANMWKNTKEVAGNGKDDDNNGYKDDIYGWNCQDNNGNIDWTDRNESGHGTHVAGVVAAVNNNGTGVCGVAGGSGKGDGVRMMSCQIFKGGQSTSMATAIAFDYARINGASIAQCSWGYQGIKYKSDTEYAGMYSAEYAAIQSFLDKAHSNSDVLDGNIIIAAAGNEHVAYSSYPAALENVISVTGIGPDYLPAVNYTNYGEGCNIAAPGGDFYVGDISSFEYNKSRVLSTFINTVTDENLGTSGHDYVYMQGTSMACPHVSGVAALGLSYARKLGKTFTREEFVAMLLTSVNDLNGSLKDGVKKSYIENGQRVEVSLGTYQGMMGTGVIDAWKMLMSVEGTPTLTVKVLAASDKAKGYSLESYFGGSASDLFYISAECDNATKEALGLDGNPELRNGKLRIKPTKAGSGKIVIKAIAGYDPNEKVDGESNIGGMEITRTISIMSRGVVSDNGGWL